MFDEVAEKVVSQVRGTGRGFLTMRRDGLRDAFGIGRFTEGQAEAVCEALGRLGVFVYPHPFDNVSTLRLYDQKHPIAGIAEAVALPDAMPETALRNASEVFARERAGRDIRSDDAPWLVAFDILLQTVIGREPEGWEEMRDDRHPSQLARELGQALGFAQGVTDQIALLRLAAAVCAFRPRRRQWLASELSGGAEGPSAVLPFIDGLEAANRRLRDEHERLLHQAARFLLRADEVPSVAVELGLLGLRYRREDGERNAL
jgi:hypothetical protein